MSNRKMVVGLFFGGKSTEHEVSVITALQAYENLDKDKYDVLPIYVSKLGQFYSNPKFLDLKNYRDVESLLLSSVRGILGTGSENIGGLVEQKFVPGFKKIDIAFPLFHGSFGEDGCIQGIFEIYGIPYVGFNVTASALGMDKVLQKAVYQQLDLRVGRYTSFRRSEWIADSKKEIKKVMQQLKFPMVVKPATSGSSIGINFAKDEDSLNFAIEVASVYADKILIEEAFQNCIEVNCSGLGYRQVKASVCEMPVKSEELLSFADKYQRGGGKGSKGSGMASLSRVIPAPISKKLTEQIQEATIEIFKAFDGCGVARIDYFVDKENEIFWVNEINSPPGSLAYYLWEKSGIEYKELLDLLIQYGLDRAEDQKKTQYTFNSGLLSQMAQKGIAKG